MELKTIMMFPAPMEPCLPPPRPKTGICQYCGQVQQVEGCQDQEQANEQVTLRCDCPEAIAYSGELSRAKKRESILFNAKFRIYRMFNDASIETKNMIEDLIAHVLDGLITGVTIQATPEIKAIIKGKDGKIIIRRVDTYAEQQEVCP